MSTKHPKKSKQLLNMQFTILSHGKKVFGSYEKTNEWLSRPVLAGMTLLSDMNTMDGCKKIHQALNWIERGLLG